MVKVVKERNLKVRHDVFGLLLQYRASKKLSIIIGKDPEEPLIVNSRGNLLDDRAVRFMIRRAAKRAGLEKDVSPHWFRHSSITFALDDGATIAQVQKMAGHADIRTTQVYLHDLDDEKGKSASEFISGIDF